MNIRIDEVGDRIYRMSTFLPQAAEGAGFTFNQFLIDGEEPLLFHCGHRKMFPAISAAVSKVIPVDQLRWLAFGHFEADECGSMNEWLAAAPNAEVMHGALACRLSITDWADRPPRVLANGETIDIGNRKVRYIDTPHVPHGWDAGVIYEETTQTLFCGDLFTQPGVGHRPLVDDDILTPSETFRRQMDYYAHSRDTTKLIDKLADLAPARLACMHGSAWQGDGAAMLRTLGASLARG